MHDETNGYLKRIVFGSSLLFLLLHSLIRIHSHFVRDVLYNATLIEMLRYPEMLKSVQNLSRRAITATSPSAVFSV
jgi:hypothetical protein